MEIIIIITDAVSQKWWYTRKRRKKNKTKTNIQFRLTHSTKRKTVFIHFNIQQFTQLNHHKNISFKIQQS